MSLVSLLFVRAALLLHATTKDPTRTLTSIGVSNKKGGKGWSFESQTTPFQSEPTSLARKPSRRDTCDATDHPSLLLSGVTKGSHNVVAHGSDGLHGVDLLHQSHGRVVVQHRLGLGAEVAKALGDGGEVVILALDQRLASDLRLHTNTHTHTRREKE